MTQQQAWPAEVVDLALQHLEADWAWDDLVIGLVKQGVDLPIDLLVHHGMQSDEALQRLAKHPSGRNLLLALTSADESPMLRRFSAAAALIAAADGDEDVISLLDQEHLEPVQDRLILRLARRGVAGLLPRLLDLLPEAVGAYPALHRYLRHSSLSRNDVERSLHVAALAAEIASPQSVVDKISFTTELLDEVGMPYHGPGEARAILGAYYRQLEERVGSEIVATMDSEELQEFESFVDQADDAGAFDWLQSWFPSYRSAVAAAYELVVEAMRRDAIRMQPEDEARDNDILAVMSLRATELGHWIRLGQNGAWAQSREYYNATPELWLPVVENLLRLAAAESGTWPEYEAHLYLMQLAGGRSVDTDDWLNYLNLDMLLDRIREHVDNRDVAGAVTSSALCQLAHPGSAPAYFYASLATAAAGWRDFPAQLMRACVDCGLSEEQRSDGVETLRREARRGFITPDASHALQTILQA